MDKQKALEKIKKCLALSKSANEHEAAQALKQAQALMKQYGIGTEEIKLSDVGEFGAQAAMTLPQWHWNLTAVCAKAFDCKRYLDVALGEMVFVGVAGKQELAAYAYEVLLRQLRKARREYMATELKRVRIAKNKTYRADCFCEGWVNTVWRQVRLFAGSKEEAELVERYLEGKKLTDAKARTVSASSTAKAAGGYDRFRGAEQGKEAQLHHAMNGTDGVKQIGGAA